MNNTAQGSTLSYSVSLTLWNLIQIRLYPVATQCRLFSGSSNECGHSPDSNKQLSKTVTQMTIRSSLLTLGASRTSGWSRKETHSHVYCGDMLTHIYCRGYVNYFLTFLCKYNCKLPDTFERTGRRD